MTRHSRILPIVGYSSTKGHIERQGLVERYPFMSSFWPLLGVSGRIKDAILNPFFFDCMLLEVFLELDKQSNDTLSEDGYPKMA